MLVEIKWHDKASQTMLLHIEGEWSYSGYNHTYMQLIPYARQVSDKINVIIDVTNATQLIEDTKLLNISPFIHHAVIVTTNPKQAMVRQLQGILHSQNSQIILSYAQDVPHATAKIRRELSVRA